jgi:hypothetical protein
LLVEMLMQKIFLSHSQMRNLLKPDRYYLNQSYP